MKNCFDEIINCGGVAIEELMKCPFCGGEARTIYAVNDINRWGVMCKNCSATVEVEDNKGIEDTEDNAIRAWNRRII